MKEFIVTAWIAEEKRVTVLETVDTGITKRDTFTRREMVIGTITVATEDTTITIDMEGTIETETATTRNKTGRTGKNATMLSLLDMLPINLRDKN